VAGVGGLVALVMATSYPTGAGQATQLAANLTVPRNLLNAGTTVSAVARSMGASRAAVHRAMERIARAAE
jgi:hypothetical protein